MKLKEIRKRALAGDLSPKRPEPPPTLPDKVQLCYRCYLPESHEVHRLDSTVGVAIDEEQARRMLRHGHLADLAIEDMPEDGPMLFGHGFVPSVTVDMCMCGVEPIIATFEVGKKMPSLPGGPASYVFARGQVRPGDKDAPLCSKCAKILEGAGFAAHPF